MTIDDAINKFRRESEQLRNSSLNSVCGLAELCESSAQDYDQIVEWLIDYKRLLDCEAIKDECFACVGCERRV